MKDKLNLDYLNSKIKNKSDLIKFVRNLLAQTGIETPKIDYSDPLESDGIIRYFNVMPDSEILFSICICRYGNISGSNLLPEENITKNLIMRLKYLLNKNFDLNDKIIKPDRILVVCFGNISNNAINEIKNKIKDAVIHFWDKDKIFSLTSQIWPDYFKSENPIIVEYCKNLLAKLEDINRELFVLYANKKVRSLWDLFIDLQLQEIKIKNIQSYINVSDLNKDYDEGYAKEIQSITLKELKKSKYKIDDILESNSDILISGDMGSGKSTILKRITQKVIEKNSLDENYNKIPIFISARSICDDGLCVEESIRKEIKTLTKNKEIDIESLISKGDIILLIDGLDEKLEDYNYQIINYLKEFKNKFPHIQTIITTRPVVIIEKESLFDNFRKFEILPLDSRQVNSLLEKWYPTDRKHKQKLLNVLKQTALINTLPKTPLTITLLAIIFEDEEKIDEIPANITELYNKFIDVFTGRWDASKGISTQDEFGIRTHLIRNIAFYLHYHNLTEIPEEKLIEIVNSYIKDKGYEEKYFSQIFDDLMKRNPLFIKIKGNYKFIHLSFQEYYACFGIRQSNDFVKDHHKFLVENFLNPRWSNVIHFYVGDLKDCPQFLQDVSKVVPSSYSGNAIEIDDNIYSTIDKNFLKIDNLSKTIQAAISTDVKYKTIALISSLSTLDNFRNNLLNLASVDKSFNAFALKIGLNDLAIINIIKELYISLFKSKYTKPSMIELFNDPNTSKKSFLASYLLAYSLTEMENSPQYLFDFISNENISLEWRFLCWNDINKKFYGKLTNEQKRIANSIGKKVKKSSAYLISALKKMNQIPRLKQKVKQLKK